MNLKCPKCGSSNVCEILYGMPTGEAYKLAEQGKMILGGCDIIIDDLPQPDYGCLDCKFEWVPELLPASYMVKIRFKVWTSIGISEDLQQYSVYEMFPNGLVRIYRYEGTSRKSVDKQVKHIEKKEVQKLSSALRKELNVPVFARENSCPEKRFNLQIISPEWAVSLELISTKEAVPFYKKRGFEERACEWDGPGMFKMI